MLYDQVSRVGWLVRGRCAVQRPLLQPPPADLPVWLRKFIYLCQKGEANMKACVDSSRRVRALCELASI